MEFTLKYRGALPGGSASEKLNTSTQSGKHSKSSSLTTIYSIDFQQV